MRREDLALFYLAVVEDCGEYWLGGSSNIDPGCPECVSNTKEYIANYSGTSKAKISSCQVLKLKNHGIILLKLLCLIIYFVKWPLLFFRHI